MATLTVQAPTLNFDAVTPGVAVLEKKFELKCGAVSFPDGRTFSQLDLGAGGFFIYRRQSAAAATEVWDEDTKEWKPESSVIVDALKPKPFFFKEGEPSPWQAVLVAAGQKDKNNADQFAKQSSGFPEYFFRVYFASANNGSRLSGLSTPSSSVRFVNLTDAFRAGIRLNDNEKPENATEIEFFLRNSALQLIGSVLLRNVGGSAEIEVAKVDPVTGPVSKVKFNTDGSIDIVSHELDLTRKAAIRLRASGDIAVEPASGRTTTINNVLVISESGGNVTLRCAGQITLDATQVNVVSGPLFAGTVHYQPADSVSGGPNSAPQFLDITF